MSFIILLSGPAKVYALEIVPEDGMAADNAHTAYTTDELLDLRASLLVDPENNTEQLEQIDQQLLALGVEKISYAEVLNKVGNTVQPMHNMVSTSDTVWYSDRWITVCRGERYEVQIIYGQMRSASSTSSPLYSFDSGACVGKADRYDNAIEVLFDDIVTAGISSAIPQLSGPLSLAITIYDAWQASGALNVTEDADYSFNVGMVTTMKFAFVKYEGALDEGNQILGYVGNSVNYHVCIVIPIVVQNEEGDFEPSTIEHKYSDNIKSYGYGSGSASTTESECRDIAALNFWNYKHGVSSLDRFHEVLRIPIMLLDQRYNALVPCTYP